MPLNEYEFPASKLANVQAQLERLVSKNYYLHQVLHIEPSPLPFNCRLALEPACLLARWLSLTCYTSGIVAWRQ